MCQYTNLPTYNVAHNHAHKCCRNKGCAEQKHCTGRCGRVTIFIYRQRNRQLLPINGDCRVILLDSPASNVSMSTVAVTVPSSEAWEIVEEKVTAPLEQEEVELWNLVLFTGQSQYVCISPKMATSIVSKMSTFMKY